MGTKLRHIVGSDLKSLQDEIESYPMKVEIKAVNRLVNDWYIHFTLLDFDELPPTIVAATKLKKKARK